jgi:hypothetical protein
MSFPVPANEPQRLVALPASHGGHYTHTYLEDHEMRAMARRDASKR